MNRFFGHLIAVSIMSISAGIGGGVSYSQPVPVYPLQVGDRWLYIRGGWGSEYESYVIHDTLMPNGHSYSAIRDGINARYTFERQSSDQVYWFYQAGGREWLQYDFSRSSGDTVLSEVFAPGDTLDIVLAYDSIASIFGKSLRQWGFAFKWRHIFDLDEFRVITDSLGLTYLLQAWGEFVLKGAVLNGVTYGTISDVNEAMSAAPRYATLKQNYPNPFNPSTTITFSVPNESNIVLKIYSVLGREIATLINEKKQPGEYSITWDAQNVPSGVYFCRLTAGSVFQTRKMVVMR